MLDILGFLDSEQLLVLVWSSRPLIQNIVDPHPSPETGLTHLLLLIIPDFVSNLKPAVLASLAVG